MTIKLSELGTGKEFKIDGLSLKKTNLNTHISGVELCGCVDSDGEGVYLNIEREVEIDSQENPNQMELFGETK